MSLVITDDQPLFKMADFTYTKRKIEEDEDISKTQQNQSSISTRVLRYMSQNKIDDYLEIFNGIVAVLFYGIYAYGTSCDKSNPLHDECTEPPWIEFLEITIIIFICIDYLLFFLVSENRILYFFSTHSWMTYITVVPTALVRARVID